MGGDAATIEKAIAYSLDANLSTLGGGTFPVADRIKLFDSNALVAQLQYLIDSEMSPITFDGDDFEEMQRILEGGFEEPDWDEHDATGTMGGDRRVGEKFVGFVLSDEQHSDWERGKEQMGVKDDKVFALKLLRSHLE